MRNQARTVLSGQSEPKQAARVTTNWEEDPADFQSTARDAVDEWLPSLGNLAFLRGFSGSLVDNKQENILNWKIDRKSKELIAECSVHSIEDQINLQADEETVIYWSGSWHHPEPKSEIQYALAFPVVRAPDLYNVVVDIGGDTTEICFVADFLVQKLGRPTPIMLEKPTHHIQITMAEARKIAFEILAEAEERRLRFAEEEANRNDIWYE